MNFAVRRKLDKSRRGVLKLDNHEVQTPGCTLYTRGGAVPHLSTDVLHSIGNLPAVTHLTLQTTIDQPGTEVINKSSYDGVKEFLRLEEFICYLSIQDPIQEIREGYNEEKSVSVWTPGGRKKKFVRYGGSNLYHLERLEKMVRSHVLEIVKKCYSYIAVFMHCPPMMVKIGFSSIDVNLFMEVLQTFKPNLVECLCDTIPASGQTEKRIRKSVDRTLKFLDKFIEEKELSKSLASCNILGVIEGSNSEKERLRSAKETSQRPVAGFVLEGFDSSICNWCSLLQKTVESLPDDKPRFNHGIGTPDEVVSAVECGIDIFDSTYPCQVADRGCALDINMSRKRFKPELTYSHAKTEQTKCREDSLNQSSNITDKKERVDAGNPYELNLNHTRYNSDFTPLVSTCTCYCCTNHTRAYVHHLLVTKEMLAKVLLMTHNLHEYFQFFSRIRLSIEEDNFREFKRFILENQPL